MNNYDVADTIRSLNKKAHKYNKISTSMWILSALGITVASGCKVAEIMYDCKAKYLFNKLDI